MTEAKQHPVPPKGRSALRLAWRMGAFCLRVSLLLAIAIAALSPRLIDRDWRFDLVTSLLAQFVLAGVVLAAWQLPFRRWIWCALFLVASAGCYAWMLQVERSPLIGERVLQHDERSLRVLQINVYSRNQQPERIITLIAEHEPDLVVMLEAPLELLSIMESSSDLLERYPYHAGLDSSSPGQIVVLSSHPLQKRADSPTFDGLNRSWGYWAGFVNIDGYPVRVAGVHAPSPRTEFSWRTGKMTFDRIGQLFERLGSPLDEPAHPTMIIGDLNAAPTSTRSRMITDRFGLLRAKPIRAWDGTFHASVPWFARSAIDDSMLSPDIAVRSWRTVGIPGSDHRGVLLELSISVGAID